MQFAYWAPIVLLICSNVFMTTAWYEQFKFPGAPHRARDLHRLAIALFECLIAVPANRIGHRVYSSAELKTMQEDITLVAFSAFSVWVLKEPIVLKHGIGFAPIVTGAG